MQSCSKFLSKFLDSNYKFCKKYYFLPVFCCLLNHPQFFTFFIGFIVLVIPLRYFTKLNRKYSHISFNSGIAISDDIERVVDNLYLIKILKNFKNEKKVFQQNLNDYYSSQLNNLKYGSLNSLVPSFMTMIFLSVLFLFTALAARITLEFIAIILRLFQSLGEFNRVLSLSIATYVHLEKFLSIEKNKENIFSENFKVVEEWI